MSNGKVNSEKKKNNGLYYKNSGRGFRHTSFLRYRPYDFNFSRASWFICCNFKASFLQDDSTSESLEHKIWLIYFIRFLIHKLHFQITNIYTEIWTKYGQKYLWNCFNTLSTIISKITKAMQNVIFFFL